MWFSFEGTIVRGNARSRGEDFTLCVSKSVPQRLLRAVKRAGIYGTVENQVFLSLGEPQAHGDTAEPVPFVYSLLGPAKASCAVQLKI